MSKKPSAGGKNPVDENVQEAFPLYDPERVPLHEALWTKGILDQAA